VIRLSAAAMTDVGRDRETNEDRVWENICSDSGEGGANSGEASGLFIVCDGIGGHLAGECASHWAVETIKRDLVDYFTPQDPRGTIRLSKEEIEAVVTGARPTRKLTENQGSSQLQKRVRQAIERANDVIVGYAKQKPQQAGDTGTTVTMAFVRGDRAIIANVGDSRTYLLRNHQFRQVTQDHSLVARLVASGQIRPDEIYSHPQRNLIFRSLGQKQKVQVDIFEEILQQGDHLLLCSDGLWEMIQDPNVIVRLIESTTDPRQACKKLIEAANAAGGADNIGVVVVKVT
jgi:serine/threonine protein phosphatase PrpC